MQRNLWMRWEISMDYKLVVTEHAEDLLDKLLYHILFCLKNESAAKHLLNSVETVYMRLEENPYQFPICKDEYLANKGYREAIVTNMNYIIIFTIINDMVSIVGVYHQLENYQNKL